MVKCFPFGEKGILYQDYSEHWTAVNSSIETIADLSVLDEINGNIDGQTLTLKKQP